MRIVVTGGCGFIGSNLIHYLIERYADVEILNLDALTYAGNRANLAELEDHNRYRFQQLDIADRMALRSALNKFHPDGIFHLAAETHVDNSISGPAAFVTTNLIGTYNLLEEAHQLWSGDPSKRFVHISTDEVYGSIEGDGAFDETSPYQPSSPYSATKAGSDHLVRAWHVTYGMNVVTTNCSNNYGPRQHREKLIPTVISTALAGKPIPIYGDGKNVRDWLFVGDHCVALDKVFREGKSGETYAIGARNEWTNIDLVKHICRILDEEVGTGPGGSYSSLITFVKDRPGHDRRYAVDPAKIERELGWERIRPFEETLRETVVWYADLMRDNVGRTDAVQQSESDK